MEYFALYVIAGLLTYANVWHRKAKLEGFERGVVSILAGFFWFLYWPGRFAILITQPKEKRA